MFDPVKMFEDIAAANSLHFIYGAQKFQNWELTQKDLTVGQMFLGMFPFRETADIANNSPDSYRVSTILWIGGKFDTTNLSGTFSSLDETEKQKYDRRLKNFRATGDTILEDLCALGIEVVSVVWFRELNKFDENADAVGCELTFRYSTSDSNSAPAAPRAYAASNILDVSFIASWSKVQAEGYRIDVATDSAFVNKVVNNVDCGSVLFRYIDGLSGGTTYYYRVRAYNDQGTSGNSNTITFTTGD